MQSQHQENDTVSVPGNVLSASPSLAPSSQEPYYSNQDIAVLHAVIIAAQEQLDRATDPKPLPAAALFKAYDEVLPQHGIDPDSDHHLSTLVFRVGGEQGNGTLSQKFQTILERMGIILEFGDDSTTSLQSPCSHSVSPAPSYSSHPYLARKRVGLEDDALRDMPQKNNITSLHETSAFQARPAEASGAGDDFDNTRAFAAIGTAASPTTGSLRSPAAQHLQHQDFEDAVITSDRLLVDPDVGDVAFEDDKANRHRLPPEGIATDGIPPPIPPPNVRKATLASVIDRWRDAMNRQREWNVHNSHSSRGAREEIQIRTRDNDANISQTEGNSRSHVDIQTHPSTLTRATEMNKAVTLEHEESHVLPDDVAEENLHVALLPKETPPPSHRANEEVNSPQQRHEQLLNRAARAREIYLASKVFNHWADRTATRLEREGVARRHMVRFRCFRGWSQAPSSRTPAIDQLRTVTAVQKLQRAVAYQEEQLSIAASAIAQNYRLKMALRVFERWLCHLMVHVSRQRTIQRAKNNALTTWKSQAAANATARQAMLRLKGHCDKSGALSRWQRQGQLSIRRLDAARQVGVLRMSFGVLGEWWDQAEVKRRAVAYRETLLMEAAGHAFYSWNLQARAQAFRWRNDYLSVTRVLDKWRRSSREDRRRQDKARGNFEKRGTSKFLDILRRADNDHAQLSRLDSRARLFIVTARVLPVLDNAVEKRKSQVKQMVKRYLMLRYTQVSSARKKRKFYWALDHWRAMTTRMLDSVELATISGMAHDSFQLQSALAKWRKCTDEDSRLQFTTSKYHKQAWLATWSDFAQGHEQRDMQVWELWATGKQRQYLKEWSISSLQRSGQAHTATIVQQKYYGEKRNRTFQQWRQASESARDASPGPDLGFTPKPGSVGGHRSGWRALSARRYLLKEGLHEQDIATGPAETPTRWTGLPLSMSFALSSRPMPPVRETDEESTFSSADGDLEMLKSPNKGHTVAVSTADLPSTTPRAPVPRYLNLDSLQSQHPKPGRFSRSVAMKSIRMKSGSPSKEPPYLPVEATPRPHLDQPRNGFRHSAQGIAPRRSSRQPEEVQVTASKSLDPIEKGRSARAQAYQSMSAITLQSQNKADAAGFRSPWPQRNGQQTLTRSLTSARSTK